MDKSENLRVGFILMWFIAAYAVLLASLFLLIYTSKAQQVLPQRQNFKLYSALPDNSIQTRDTITKADARAKIIADFFKKYNAPLASFAGEFITVADKYRLDYRLLPAISMQESNGGKKIIDDSYNPFGFGIYANNVLRFSSFAQAIEKVGQSLRNNYLDQGLTSPEEIMAKYTPPALARGGDWAKGVTSFMKELQ